MPGRPWISEIQSVGGDRLNFLSLVYVGVLVLVISAWVKSAGPMLGTTFDFIGLDKLSPIKRYTPTPTLEPTIISYDLIDVITKPTATQTAFWPTNTATFQPTATQESTATMTMTQTPTITMTATPQPVIHSPGIDPDESTLVLGDPVAAKISYYWPPLCGTEQDPDCWNGGNDQTASGYYWHYEGVGRWMACPLQYPFGTEFYINGYIWKCMDRGSMIDCGDDGFCWFDLLYPYMPYGFTWSEKLYIYPVLDEYEIDLEW